MILGDFGDPGSSPPSKNWELLIFDFKNSLPPLMPLILKYNGYGYYMDTYINTLWKGWVRVHIWYGNRYGYCTECIPYWIPFENVTENYKEGGRIWVGWLGFGWDGWVENLNNIFILYLTSYCSYSFEYIPSQLITKLESLNFFQFLSL